MPAPVFTRPIVEIPGEPPTFAVSNPADVAELNRVVGELYGTANPEDRERAEDAADRAEAEADIATTQAAAALVSAAQADQFATQAELAALAAGAPIVMALTSPVPANGTVELLKLDAGLQVHEVVTGAWVLRGWLVGPNFDTVALLLASTATTLGAAGTIVEAGGIRYEIADSGASDNDKATAGGVKLYTLRDLSDTLSPRPAYIEQFVSGFGGRGMLDSETINLVTEQAIAAAGSAGDSTVAVTSDTNFLVGARVTIEHENGRYGTYFVSAKSSNVLTIRPALRWDVTTSSRIERTWFNRAHPGKFYMRELAQKIAYSTELEAAIPSNRRVLFTNFTGSASVFEDQLTVVGTATLNYFDGANLGSTATVTSPLRFPMSRNAFVSSYTLNSGVETRLFAAPDGDYIAKVVLFVDIATPKLAIQILDDGGDIIGTYAVPPGADQQIPRVYTVPFRARGQRYVKLRVVCTANAGGVFALGQIDVFDAPSDSGLLITKKGAIVVCLGDSWMAGDLGGSPEREPIPQQLALERPDLTIINSGVGGEKVWEQLARFDVDVAAHNPDYVVINTGTNESYNPASATFYPNATDYFIQQFRLLLSRIQAIGARAIIIGTPGLAETDGAFTSWALNDRARIYAREFFLSMANRPLAYGAKSGLEAYGLDATITTGATPSVANMRRVDLTYGSATTITNLLGGVTGQMVTFVATNDNATFQDNANLDLGGANITLLAGKAITFLKTLSGVWIVAAPPLPVPAGKVSITLTDADGTTPSVAGADIVYLNYSSATTITNFTGAVKDQEVEVHALNANVTLASSSGGFFRLAGLVNLPLTADSIVNMRRFDPLASARWVEKSRSIK